MAKKKFRELQHSVTAALPAIADWTDIALKSANDIIGICNIEGKVLYISPSSKKVLGWYPEELVNRIGTEIAHPDDLETIQKNASKLKKNKIVTYEWRAMNSEGKYIWLEQSFQIVSNQDTDTDYIVFIARNVNHRKALEEKLAKTAEALSQSNQMKDKLLSLVAHDLQNPIYSIITLTSFIRKNLDSIRSQELTDFISQISESAQNSYILLENLILWDRIQRGSLTLRPEHIKVKKMIADTLKLIEQQVSHKKLVFTTLIDDDLYIYSDFYTLDTIIKNIISNAVKYTPAKGKITISAVRENSDIIIKIADSGIGMTKEQLKYLFQPDSRKRLNGLSTSHGSGLGLILCRELIAKYEGQIDVESHVNKGSTFTITFPQPHKKNSD